MERAEEIPIEQLSLYLGYELQLSRGKRCNIATMKELVAPRPNIKDVGYFVGYIIHHKNKDKFERNYNYAIKPIVRPLDLTKEIKHNGKKIIPIKELAYWLYNEEKENFDSYESAELWISGNVNYDKCDYLNLPFKIVIKLISWQYDIFNWILDGLAINKNTLNG